MKSCVAVAREAATSVSLLGFHASLRYILQILGHGMDGRMHQHSSIPDYLMRYVWKGRLVYRFCFYSHDPFTSTEGAQWNP